MITEFKDSWGSIINLGSKVSLLEGDKTGVVVKKPRRSIFTPWHVLVSVRWDDSKTQTDDIRLIEEIKVV